MIDTAFYSGNLIVHNREYQFDLKLHQDEKGDIDSKSGINNGPITFLAVYDPLNVKVLWYDREWIVAPNQDPVKAEILKLILLEFGGTHE